ncbi:hypothetical protein GOHSU_27_00170 [Gordonia hirsuta DSM 44140 = NBRC 16056]|uniref:Uncharacterized protein n=1 Tax=Gordonia hirsuta DSM 44140 = NBRC 16056 TaxID=1121927 RepID=L7LAV4_9ACTN|nr:hypothetical protein [Gordonia hirsuta]GAC57881.1 hypothetical protein GOHSU_27_00170 [Gordonia hirsuta DSM 44140 = NBRC 16056]
MVRPDHEDGAVLNPDEHSADQNDADQNGADQNDADQNDADQNDGVDQTRPAAVSVVKTSPLGRRGRRKSVRPPSAGAAGPDSPAGTDSSTDRDSGSDRGVAVDSGSPAAPEAPAGADAAADETLEVVISEADAVSYRDRRLAASRRRTAAEAAPARSTGSRSMRALAFAAGAVLLIAGLVGSILLSVGLVRLHNERDLRAEYTAFARQVVVQMTTLDAENADAMYELALEKTSGRAQQVFKENMKQVSEMIRQADAVTKTTVLTEAVSEATEKQGTVLMVIGWESRTKDGQQEPLYQTFRFLVGMTRINDELKATDLEFVW